MSETKCQSEPLRLAVFISGGGSTLLNLHQKSFEQLLNVEIPLVIASRQCSGVEKCRAAELNVVVEPAREYSSPQLYSDTLFSHARNAGADLVVLAGFLSRIVIPDDFQNRVMNIHPSLIPAFCGQGMYGQHVHEAVIARGCKVSGCTVHFCDNEYDHGPIILQQTVPVAASDTPDQLAARVQAAECEAYPRAIQLFSEGRLRIASGKVHILDDATNAEP